MMSLEASIHPSFSEPYVIPYKGGFDFTALDTVIQHTTPTIQDMSILVLDNAHFSGEAMDVLDRPWYTMPGDIQPFVFFPKQDM